MSEVDLQQILRATTNSYTDLMSGAKDDVSFKEATHSSLNLHDFLPHFNEQAKILANQFS